MSRPTILMEEEAILKYWELFRLRMHAVQAFLGHRQRAWYRHRERINKLNEELDEIYQQEQLALQQSILQRWRVLCY